VELTALPHTDSLAGGKGAHCPSPRTPSRLGLSGVYSLSICYNVSIGLLRFQFLLVTNANIGRYAGCIQNIASVNIAKHIFSEITGNFAVNVSYASIVQ